MNVFDRENIKQIVEGYGDWFGALLIRTIAQGDDYQRALLFMSFPQEVQAIYNLDLPPGAGGIPFDQALERLWLKADAENKQKLARSFVKFERRMDW